MVVAMSEIVVNPFHGAKPARNLSRIKKQFLANLTLRRKRSNSCMGMTSGDITARMREASNSVS